MLESTRILLVNDIDDEAEPLTLALEAHGASVARVRTAAEALGLLEGGDFDVVVCGLGPPGGRGEALARAVHARPETGTAPPITVAVTGWVREADRRRALAAGFSHVCPKPSAPDAVAHAISRLVAGRG